jgi:hypothetical protein
MVFNSKDQDLLTSLEKYAFKKRQGTGKSNDYGIDFTSDLYVFTQDFKDGYNYVILFPLLDESLFLKNIPNYLEKNQSFTSKGNLGILVSHFSSSKISKVDLDTYLELLLKNKQKSKFEFIKSENEFTQAHLNSFTVNEDIIVDKGSFISTLDERKLDISGEFSLKSIPEITSKWKLNKAGLHIESAMISKTIQDSIHNYFLQIGFQIADLKRISINYYGLEIQETDKGLTFSPVFDLLLTFKNSFSIEDVISDESLLEELGFKREGNKFLAGNLTYTIDSLDCKNLFIGRNINQVALRKNTTLFEINGDLSQLTTINGGGFISSFIQAFPPFRASKELFSTLENVQISAELKNKELKLNGKIVAKKDKFIFNEFIRFFLAFKGEL